MRILIVEDDKKIANALKKGLELENYAVDAVYDGEKGLVWAVTKEYDLVILDRMLPGIADGLNICRAMRDKGKHTPVLVLTARDKLDDKVQGLNLGADDYLTKPFAFEELLARVKALFRRPKKSLGTLLVIDNLTMDTINFKVERNGELIELTPTEFKLLEYLMRNKGRILTKQEIINHVWDWDANILPNTVEVYIKYLRNKVDKMALGEPLIHTVRGYGYKLEPKS
jgi:DNA-binding response OmpR family regulator